jgi:hypothetical protein
MNFFTKEWYELCQKISAHFRLEEEKQAEFFSEEYFQQLYNEKLTDWLNLEEKIESCKNNHEPINKSSILHSGFDRENAAKQFQQRFVYYQEYVKKLLPKEILKDIADIRVYVLDKASAKVINAVTKFCENNKKLIDRTVEEYSKYYKNALKSLDCNIVNNINFHDCIIVDIKQTEHALTMLFDNSGGFTNIDEMQFENYCIIKQDGLLQNSWWLYNEVYKVNGKYEVHVLLENKHMGLIEFTISAENISFKHKQ